MNAMSDEELLLADTVRVSRALGNDPFLVLHGGGNTSVKRGNQIWVKASGFDLGQLTQDGLVELDRGDLSRMLDLPSLSDTAMMEGYRRALVQPDDPSPTIETLVHHALPFPSVLHSHADAIVTLTDTVGGANLVRDALGEDVIYLPYAMPGFDLARQVLSTWEACADARPTAFVLAHHGLFTAGDNPEAAYQRHLDLVDRATAFVTGHTGVDLREPMAAAQSAPGHQDLERLTAELARHAVGPVTVLAHHDQEIAAFLARADFPDIAQQGPTTLEHVIRTKRLPMVDGDVEGYVDRYRQYYGRHAHRAHLPTQMLDPVPRVVLDPTLGLVTTGTDESAARAAQDIYRHTIRIISAAEALGGYRTIDEGQAFDIEYWELEQRRLRPGT